MVLKRIIFEFEKTQETGRGHNKPSGSCDNAPHPPNINVSLDNCSTEGRGDLDTNDYTGSRFVSESMICSTSAILPQNNRRSLSVSEGSGGGSLTQDNASTSRDGDLLNNAFRRTINSSCSYLSNKFDSVSSGSSVFSVPNISPIPYYDPFDKINHDKLYSQSPVLSSSSNFNKNPMKSTSESDMIKKFYEIKSRKSTSQIKSNDHIEKKLFEMIKEIKIIVNNSNENFVAMENSSNLSENEVGVVDDITEKASRITYPLEKKRLHKESNSTNEDDSVFSATQFNFEYLLDDQSLDFLLFSPVPQMNLPSSITDLDNNNHNNDNNLLEDKRHIQIS